MAGKVLIYKETLLPPPETFILAQARALGRYSYRLAGLERCARSLPVEDALVLTEIPGTIAELRAKLYRRLGWAPRFHRRARKFAPDLVHAHFASGGRSAIPMARALGVPLIVTLHGADITVRGGAERYRQLAEKATVFLCVSEFIRGRALEAGLPAEKLTLHYIGIDRALFVPAEEMPEAAGVLFVGRLVEKKGCEYLIRAMRTVQRTHPNATLTVIGDGPLRPGLQKLAAEAEVNCRFLGTLAAGEVRRQLRETSIFCVPSVQAANGDSEGLGMVFAEAGATGVPVVSTRHGGIPEVVRHELTGLLVEERNVLALALAIERLLGNRALRKQFGAAASRFVAQRFDLAKQTAQLELVYDEVVRCHKHAQPASTTKNL